MSRISIQRPVLASAGVLASLLWSATAAGMPQAPDLEVLVLGNTPLPGSSLTFLEAAGLTADPEGGWACTATMGVDVSVLERALLGDLSADGSRGPSILRRPTSIQGYDQRRLGKPDLRGDELAYLASRSEDPADGFDSAWVEDELIAQIGDPIGASGQTWERISDIRFGFEDRHFLRGRTAAGAVIVRQPTGSILLATGDQLPLLTGPVNRIERFDASPNGQHWAARVVLDDMVQFRQAMIVGGAGMAAGGAVVIERRELGPDFGLPGARWNSFLAFDVDNAGRVTLQARIDLPDGTQDTITIRGNRLIDSNGGARSYRGAFGSLPGTPQALYSEGASLLVESVTLVDDSARIDADGDGMADPGFSLGADALGGAGWAPVVTSAGVTGRCLVDLPGPGSAVPALVRVARSPVGTDVCMGVPNSTFLPSALTAVGQLSRQVNDLTLVCTDLPADVMGYALASRQSGFLPAPNGSMGNLCLGGEIGRLIGDMFVAEPSGFASVPVDLARIPKPIGTISATAGETWYFQAWHRDRNGASVTSNFSSAVSVTLIQ